MQIEEGKYYITRGGLKVGPMKPSGYKKWPWFVVMGDGQYWDSNGFGVYGTDSPDLIAEWSEDASSPISVTDTDENGEKHYLSDYPDTISAEIGGLYEEPKIWRDMTPEEKGALLLAHHEGGSIQRYCKIRKEWVDASLHCGQRYAYRVKPEPKVETVALDLCGKDGWSACEFALGERQGRYTITFDTIDGKPDTSSIKMETL